MYDEKDRGGSGMNNKTITIGRMEMTTLLVLWMMRWRFQVRSAEILVQFTLDKMPEITQTMTGNAAQYTCTVNYSESKTRRYYQC